DTLEKLEDDFQFTPPPSDPTYEPPTPSKDHHTTALLALQQDLASATDTLREKDAALAAHTATLAALRADLAQLHKDKDVFLQHLQDRNKKIVGLESHLLK